MHALGDALQRQLRPDPRQDPSRGIRTICRGSRFWSVWNEPDYGPSLAPAGSAGTSTVENSPRVYRNLVDAAWSALHQTGHGHDTFLFGELAHRGGLGLLGRVLRHEAAGVLRALYCVGSTYRPLERRRGGDAAAVRRRRPPRGASALRTPRCSARRDLGSPVHALVSTEPRAEPRSGQQVDDGGLLLAGDDRQSDRGERPARAAYGSPAHLQIFDTEFGYITSPPKHDNQREPKPPYYYPWVSTATAAYYLNWAEYISWQNPRVGSFCQYLLHDPLPVTRATTGAASRAGC